MSTDNIADSPSLTKAPPTVRPEPNDAEHATEILATIRTPPATKVRKRKRGAQYFYIQIIIIKATRPDEAAKSRSTKSVQEKPQAR